MYKFLSASSCSIILLLGLHGFVVQAAPYVDQDDTVEIVSNAIDNAEQLSSTDIIDLSFYGSSIYGKPDTETTGQLVANFSTETAVGNPEELGSYLEGDILVPAAGKGLATTRNGVTTRSSRWPNGVVPYEIAGSFSSRDLSLIDNAIKQYHTRTCIRFVRRSNEYDYVSITSSSSGCWSSVGKIGGKQEVNLQTPGCMSKPGTAIHELMHALGFLHEQNRQERDGYVSIQYQNVQPSAKSNFDRASNTNAFGVPYDYNSVMHYSPTAFSINGRPTIVATQPGSTRMGQRDGFSEYDVRKLNEMYGCRIGGATPSVPYVAPAPTPAAGPTPIAGNANANSNPVINSFLGGLLSGLGLADDKIKAQTQ